MCDVKRYLDATKAPEWAPNRVTITDSRGRVLGSMSTYADADEVIARVLMGPVW